MKSIQSSAAMFGQNRYGCRFDDLDIKRQVQVLIEEFGQLHLARDKRASYRTAKARAYVAHAVISELRGSGYKIKNIRNLDQRHITIVVGRWLEKGLSASTLQTRFSILRWLAAAIGKAGLVRDPSFYSVPNTAIQRTYVATEDKSWSSHGVDSRAVIDAAAQEDEWVSAQLDMMDAFGLRLAEAILIEPARARTGNVLRVEKGTKGGRTRLVHIRNDAQEQALQRASEFAAKSARGNLVPPGKNVQQAKDRLYYIVSRKLGISKAARGVTPHGLRHQFANDYYEEEAGQPTVLRGGNPVERSRDLAARQVVTNALGHSRLGVTASYTGPRPKGRPASDPRPALETELPTHDEEVAQ